MYSLLKEMLGCQHTVPDSEQIRGEEDPYIAIQPLRAIRDTMLAL